MRALMRRPSLVSWAHNYPDQPTVHGTLGSGFGEEAYPEMTRMDWAVELSSDGSTIISRGRVKSQNPRFKFKPMMVIGT